MRFSFVHNLGNGLVALFLCVKKEQLSSGVDALHCLAVLTESTCVFLTTQLCQDVPRLKHVATVVLKVFTGSESLRIRNQIEEIMEGLFAHFFSEHQSSYHVEDIRWFLEIANLQSQWQVNYLMNEVIDAEYTDDLLSRADFSLDATTEPSSNCWSFCASMSTFKFYLLRILRKSARTIEDSIDSVMLFFKKNQVSYDCFYTHVHVCMVCCVLSW